MGKIIEELVLTFFIALGVVLGGAISGSLGASLVNRYPQETMLTLARQIKVWAILVALGAPFLPFTPWKPVSWKGSCGLWPGSSSSSWSPSAGPSAGTC